MTDLVIQTKGLTKRYGDFVAVNDLDLAIKPGEIYGLLGPNGSGKTTTILMLLGLTEPSGGHMRVLGLDPGLDPLGVKAQVGYLPDSVGFYDHLTARDNLFYTARLNGLARPEANRRIDEALERLGLAPVADKRVGAYSRGMRQRLGVAEILLKRPRLIIMDEPTLGLDPEAANLFLQLVRDLQAEGITVLLSSHLLHQVQAVCDRVGLFRRGEIVLEGTVAELAQRVLGNAYHVSVEVDEPCEAIATALGRLDGVVSVARPNGCYVLESTCDLRPEAAAAVIKAGGRLRTLEVERPNLDDIYTRYFKEVEHDA